MLNDFAKFFIIFLVAYIAFKLWAAVYLITELIAIINHEHLSTGRIIWDVIVFVFLFLVRFKPKFKLPKKG